MSSHASFSECHAVFLQSVCILLFLFASLRPEIPIRLTFGRHDLLPPSGQVAFCISIQGLKPLAESCHPFGISPRFPSGTTAPSLFAKRASPIRSIEQLPISLDLARLR